MQASSPSKQDIINYYQEVTRSSSVKMSVRDFQLISTKTNNYSDIKLHSKIKSASSELISWTLSSDSDQYTHKSSPPPYYKQPKLPTQFINPFRI